MPQTGKNLVVAFKVETTMDTAPGASGAEQLRLAPSPGLTLRKQPIRSNEIRSDGLTTVPRHGSRDVAGSYAGELSVSSWETILAAVARATITAASTITDATASLTNVVFGTNYVALTTTTSTGGWVTAGVKVGDVFRITGTGDSNDDINAQAMAVGTHTVTVHDGAFTAVATATAFSLTIGRKISNGTTPIRRTYYIDEYNQDIDLSEAFGGCRFTGFEIRGSPNGMAEITVGAMGLSATALTTATSPYYSAPTQYTTDPLAFSDAVISLRGTKIAVATAFTLSCQLTAETLPVIGSDVSPDVFDNELRLTGSISVLREDLANLTSFADEDEIELSVLLQESGDDPKGYIGLFVPKLKFMGLDAPLGSNNALVETIPFEAGFKASATGYDQTLLSITTNS